MAVKLHRCTVMWIKGPHPCWKVQKALDETGTPYELVQHPPLRGRRTELEALSGQRKLPVIEFEDGRVLREESKDLAARIRRGELSATAPASDEAPA
jgi:Glutathione S-transferase, N-terminal domain